MITFNLNTRAAYALAARENDATSGAPRPQSLDERAQTADAPDTQTPIGSGATESFTSMIELSLFEQAMLYPNPNDPGSTPQFTGDGTW